MQEGLTDASLEKHCALYVPFLRKLVLHDVWLAHRRGQVPGAARSSHLFYFVVNRPPSPTARLTDPQSHNLRKTLGSWAAGPDLCSMSLPRRPRRATAALEQQPLVHFLGKVVPGKKWLKRHTQHVCCELRRWRTRKKDGNGRVREQGGVLKRAKARAERLRKVSKNLGFTAVASLKKTQKGRPSSLESGTA